MPIMQLLRAENETNSKHFALLPTFYLYAIFAPRNRVKTKW